LCESGQHYYYWETTVSNNLVHAFQLTKTSVVQDRPYFASVMQGILTFVQCFTGDSWASVIVRTIMDQGDDEWYWLTYFFFIFYMVFTTIVIINIFTARHDGSGVP